LDTSTVRVLDEDGSSSGLPSELSNVQLYELYLEAHDFYDSNASLLDNLPTKVAERAVFPLDNSNRILTFQESDKRWQSLGQPLDQIGASFPAPAAGSVRQYRLKTCHWDEYVSHALQCFINIWLLPHELISLPTAI
jgi:hypothetical protein